MILCVRQSLKMYVIILKRINSYSQTFHKQKLDIYILSQGYYNHLIYKKSPWCRKGDTKRTESNLCVLMALREVRLVVCVLVGPSLCLWPYGQRMSLSVEHVFV